MKWKTVAEGIILPLETGSGGTDFSIGLCEEKPFLYLQKNVHYCF